MSPLFLYGIQNHPKLKSSIATALVISSTTTSSVKASGCSQLHTDIELGDIFHKMTVGVGPTNIAIISSTIGAASTKESLLVS